MSSSNDHDRASVPTEHSRPEKRWKRRPKGHGAKGKQIHICHEVHDGETCGKVYSRAEHLRRHHTRHHSSGTYRRTSLSSTNSEKEVECSSYNSSDEVDRTHRESHPKQSNEAEEVAEVELSRLVGRQPYYNQARKPDATSKRHNIGEFPHYIAKSLGLRDGEDMKLMGYWIDRYNQSFDLEKKPVVASHEAFYTTHTPRVCANDPHVRDMVLSIASSHMQLHTETGLAQKRLEGVRYQKALMTHRNRVQVLNSGGGASWTDAELETAVFMSYLISIRAIINTQQMESRLSADGLLNQLLLRQHLLKGYHQLYQFAYPRIESRPLSTLLLHVYKDQAGLFSVQGPDYNEIAMPIHVMKQYFPELLDRLDTETIANDLCKVYRSVVRLINWVYEAHAENYGVETLQARWLISNAGLSTDFISLLQSRQPLALVIYAYFICLENLPGISKIWWVHGDTRARVTALRSVAPLSWRRDFQLPIDVAHDKATRHSTSRHRIGHPMDDPTLGISKPHAPSVTAFAPGLDKSCSVLEIACDEPEQGTV